MCASESSAIGSGFFFSSICGRLVGGPFTLVTFPLAAILGGEGSVLAFLLWGGGGIWGFLQLSSCGWWV